MSVLSHSPMIMRSAGSAEILRLNRPFSEHMGLDADELTTRPLLDWIHPEDRGDFERAVATGEGCVRARHARRDGGWASFDWKVRTDAGRVLTLGRLHAEDEGSSAVAEPELLSQHQSLSRILDNMASIVEAKNPGLRCSILLVDVAHRCIAGGAGPSLPAEYNAAVEGLLIGPSVGSCGTAAFWNVPVIVEDIAADPLWSELKDVAEKAGVAACWSWPVTSTSGEVLGAMALYDDEPSAPTQGQLDGLEIAARMVGLAVERHRLEEQLRQAEKLKALGVLAGGIAHDFNNMLTTILGNAELGMGDVPAGSPARAMLQDIVTASTNAAELCDQLLAYSGRGALSTEALELNELIEELGGLLRVAISRKVELVKELCAEPLGVLADHSQLSQVVMNLITNAAEAIGNRDGRIVIETSARTYAREELDLLFGESRLKAGAYVALRVSDSGAGMDPETQALIFDPYFTTKSSGHGLGLAAVQGIVRSHEGAIRLSTTRGVGTTFTVLLPRVPIPDRIPPRVQETLPRVQSARILVVDDEEPVRQTLTGVLERGGYEVLTAEDGREAIDVFRARRDGIDCVLLDYSMPRLDGEETMHRLQRMGCDVPVVLNSGFVSKETMRRLSRAGFAGFLKKPATTQSLLAKLADVLATAAEASERGDG